MQATDHALIFSIGLSDFGACTSVGKRQVEIPTATLTPSRIKAQGLLLGDVCFEFQPTEKLAAGRAVVRQYNLQESVVPALQVRSRLVVTIIGNDEAAMQAFASEIRTAVAVKGATSGDSAELGALLKRLGVSALRLEPSTASFTVEVISLAGAVQDDVLNALSAFALFTGTTLATLERKQFEILETIHDRKNADKRSALISELRFACLQIDALCFSKSISYSAEVRRAHALLSDVFRLDQRLGRYKGTIEQLEIHDATLVRAETELAARRLNGIVLALTIVSAFFGLFSSLLAIQWSAPIVTDGARILVDARLSALLTVCIAGVALALVAAAVLVWGRRQVTVER